jgi:aryl-alcohol dehydrogenase-like predicted oxidoreductase
MTKLVLGSVQFGINYGISNQKGKTNFSEVKEILNFAKKSKINLIDTAIAYGDSEEILGKTGINNFNFISKLPKIPKNCRDVDYWVQDNIEASLIKLRVQNLYGLLIHDTKDLTGTFGKKLANSIQKIRSNGLIKKTGISIYDTSEIEIALKILKLDLVQAPLNIIDRRLEISGILSKLKSLKVEVHTRSTFLQGLLLLPQEKIPFQFNRWSNIWDQWFLELKKKNLDPIEVCLSYPMSLPEVDRIVIGVNNLDQLKKLIKLSKSKILNHDFSFMISNDNLLINPTNWENT